MNMECIIVGSGKCGKIEISDRENTFVIAADGGFKTLKEAGITPDLTIGDFDSSDSVPETDNIIFLPVEKDDTDMAAAVKKGFEKGIKSFYLYGGCGGREDHTFANYQLLSYIAENGGVGYLIGDEFISTVIKNSSFSFDKDKRGIVSVFSLTDNSYNVSIKGLKYELQNKKLKNTFPLGVSNKFIGKNSKISVEKGSLLITFSR